MKESGIVKRVEKARNGMSVINPQIVSSAVSKSLEVLGNLYDKYRTGKYTRPIYEFFNGKDADLSQEEYIAKHGYGKPYQGLGAVGLIGNIETPAKIINGAGKIIDLNKISKSNLTLSEPDKYITLMHGTAPTSIPSIISKGFEVPGGNILSTATLEVGPTPKRIFDFFNGKGGVGQANNGAAAIIRIPKSELPGLNSGRKIADAIDDVFMGDDAITRIPAKYITGFYKTQMKKQGGILKRVESGKPGMSINKQKFGESARNSSAPFIQRLLSGNEEALINDNGERETHLMASSGKYVFPMIQKIDGQLVKFDN